MNKLGKILGPIVALLAIAAAVLSFLIASQRVLFRDRAASLSEAVASMTAKLDEGSASGLKNKVSFMPVSPSSPKEGGTLGWESYKSARKAADGSYDKTIKQAVDLSGKVQKQRNDLAAGLLEVAVSMGYPSEVLPQATDLTSLEKYSETVPKVDDFAKALVKRDQQIVANIKGVASLLRCPFPGSFMRRPLGNGPGGKVLKPYNVNQDFVKIKAAVNDLKSRDAELVKAVSSTVRTINTYKGWKVVPRKLSGTSSKDLKKQLDIFNKDCMKINTMLKQVDVWKKDMQRMQNQKKEFEDRIASLIEEKESLEKKIQEFEKKFGNHAGAEAEALKEKVLPVLEKKIDVPLNLAGKILKVNKEMNYVMIDLTNHEVVKDLSLAVVREGAYIATITVYEAGKDFSMANILSGELDKLKQGDDVIISALDLQKIQASREKSSEEEE